MYFTSFSFLLDKYRGFVRPSGPNGAIAITVLMCLRALGTHCSGSIVFILLIVSLLWYGFMFTSSVKPYISLDFYRGNYIGYRDHSTGIGSGKDCGLG